MTSKVSHLFVKASHGAPMDPCQSVEAVTGSGLSGDAAFGTARRQVLLIDEETLTSFRLPPGAVRENIVTRGLPLSGLVPGTRLAVGDAILQVTGACTPCDYLETIRPGLRNEIAGRRGMLARVERGGRITIGAPIHLVAVSASADVSHG